MDLYFSLFRFPHIFCVLCFPSPSCFLQSALHADRENAEAEYQSTVVGIQHSTRNLETDWTKSDKAEAEWRVEEERLQELNTHQITAKEIEIREAEAETVTLQSALASASAKLLTEQNHFVEINSKLADTQQKSIEDR